MKLWAWIVVGVVVVTIVALLVRAIWTGRFQKAIGPNDRPAGGFDHPGSGPADY